MSIEHDHSHETPDPDSHDGHSGNPGAVGLEPLSPWDWLPRLPLRQLRLEERLTRWKQHRLLTSWLNWLEIQTGETIELGPLEIAWRASGLKFPWRTSSSTVSWDTIDPSQKAAFKLLRSSGASGPTWWCAPLRDWATSQQRVRPAMRRRAARRISGTSCSTAWVPIPSTFRAWAPW
jgi:hypothetical protein